ncbi:myosin light chain kinase 3-like [Hoplias malabaricus]|uniref:myosin light chain kinase 3-like n=1 Tax=Hoplias malabaricus TaxID=27720 RepID=UPI0034623A21
MSKQVTLATCIAKMYEGGKLDNAGAASRAPRKSGPTLLGALGNVEDKLNLLEGKVEHIVNTQGMVLQKLDAVTQGMDALEKSLSQIRQETLERSVVKTTHKDASQAGSDDVTEIRSLCEETVALLKSLKQEGQQQRKKIEGIESSVSTLDKVLGYVSDVFRSSKIVEFILSGVVPWRKQGLLDTAEEEKNISDENTVKGKAPLCQQGTQTPEEINEESTVLCEREAHEVTSHEANKAPNGPGEGKVLRKLKEVTLKSREPRREQAFAPQSPNKPPESPQTPQTPRTQPPETPPTQTPKTQPPEVLQTRLRRPPESPETPEPLTRLHSTATQPQSLLSAPSCPQSGALEQRKSLLDGDLEKLNRKIYHSSASPSTRATLIKDTALPLIPYPRSFNQAGNISPKQIQPQTLTKHRQREVSSTQEPPSLDSSIREEPKQELDAEHRKADVSKELPASTGQPIPSKQSLEPASRQKEAVALVTSQPNRAEREPGSGPVAGETLTEDAGTDLEKPVTSQRPSDLAKESSAPHTGVISASKTGMGPAPKSGKSAASQTGTSTASESERSPSSQSGLSPASEIKTSPTTQNGARSQLLIIDDCPPCPAPFEHRIVSAKQVPMGCYYAVKPNELLGGGRFGQVHKCAELSSGLTLAAKIIKVKGMKERDEVKNEIGVMNQLSHVNLIQLYDAFESRTNLTLIMEYVEGGELFDRIVDEQYHLTELDAIIFVRQICEGVQYLHQQYILHLDLKPENILCVSNTGNQIKIIDFGLARKYRPREKLKVNFGTPEFLAPEVVNYDFVSFPTDMWSIGVITYMLLSGLSPFLGENDTETMNNILHANWDFDSEAFESVSEEAKDFISRLLIPAKCSRLSASGCMKHSWLNNLEEKAKRHRVRLKSQLRLQSYLAAHRQWKKHFYAVAAANRLKRFQQNRTMSSP